MAVESKQVELQQPIEYRHFGELMVTTPGRVIFNAAVERALTEAHRGSGEAGPARVHQPDALQEGDGRPDHGALRPPRRGVAGGGARRDQDARVPVRHPGGRDDLEERHRHPAREGGDPRRVREAGRRGRGAVRARPHHRGGAAREHRQHLDGGDRRGRRRDGEDALRAEPDLHDGQLRRPRLVQADPPARRHARPDGESEGRDHRAADQGELHGGPVGARVLHLDARRPQGPRRHRAPHGGLGLPDPPPGRRLAGRDHPRQGLQVRRVNRPAALPARGREPQPARPGDRAGRLQAARLRQARQDEAAREGRRCSTTRCSRRSSPRSRTASSRRCRSAPCSSARASTACARPATASSSPPAGCARSATRSASSPRSRSASRAPS